MCVLQSLVEHLFGTVFHVTGDLISRDHPALIIMNHRTRLDWLFLWNALYKMDPLLLTTEKISLKAPLKSIPGAGWAMGCGSYIFLERSFDNDKATMAACVKYYKQSGNNYQLLLFPEGTDRGARAAAQSDEYARQNGLPRYDYVLHPRTTGFNYLLNVMRSENYISCVYDITVAYEDVIIDSEMSLLKGLFPKNIHFNVKKYDVKEIPSDPEESGIWLKELWREKEEALKKFYESEPHKRRLDPSGVGYMFPVRTEGIGYYVAFTFWILMTAVWLHSIYAYYVLRLYVILVSLFYIYVLKRYNGIEFLRTMGVGEPPVVATKQHFLIRLRGWIFCAFTLISALLGTIFIITPLLPIMYINPRLWRKCMDRLVGIWVVMPGALMTYIFGAKVRIRGDMIDHSKPALIIMNHRTRLDWLYFWNALFKMDPWLCTSEKIILKGILRLIPGA
ncbi:Acyltransferase, partial [Ostertagia ostertagi]